MQGDPKVDELMRPVLAAIKRHVKNSDAITDIYNRAYEAVMNSMDVKTGKTYCAYCGAEYPLDDSAATLVSEHIKTCAKHPMRAKEAETAALKARAEAAEARADALQADKKRIEAQLSVMSAAVCMIAGNHPDLFTGEVQSASLTIARTFAPWVKKGGEK